MRRAGGLAPCRGAGWRSERLRVAATLRGAKARQLLCCDIDGFSLNAAVRVQAHERVFDIDMQRCSNCRAGELKIFAAILERPVIEKNLSYLGLVPQPLPKGRVREAGALRCLSHLRCRIPIATGCDYPAAGVALRAVSASRGQHQGLP